ncbi:MmcQ/YjbR family DNA-binding protein [Arthrobacter sp.]|uniref:MmcQ/YjbR family DNA-binding protein n=1 Tax=Arthrobacter sp. TaxID=1667 RepID=UPI003A91654F
MVERPSWNRPAWFARTLMARMWDDTVLTVKTTEREALAATDPAAYFWTPHHDASPQLVLVRLESIDDVELRELLADSHRLAGG